MDSFKTNCSETENLRDIIIASCITKDTDMLLLSLEKLAGSLNIGITENDQKAVNQILHCIRHFRKIRNIDNKRTIKLYDEIYEFVKNLVREQSKNPETISFNDWISGVDISEEQLKIIIENLSSLQITTGCSNFCRRCNEWALPSPRKHFNFEAVKTFLSKLKESNNRDFNLYCASDPLDWKSGEKNITDLNNISNEMGVVSNFGILTKVPKGKEKLLKKLLNENADIGISITERNRERLKKSLGDDYPNLFKQHETEELSIPAGLDEDFSSIKPSITDSYGIEITADGVFQILPTFTSALSLTGQARFRINKDTNLFIKQASGRKSLSIQYFKPLTLINLKGEEITLNYLLDPQIENIILDRAISEVDPPGIMNLKEFMRSFDKSAVLVRKKISEKVLKEALEKFKDREVFEEYRKYYLKSCDPEGSFEMRIDAVIFLLKEVKRYVSENRERIPVVRHLRKTDLIGLKDRYEKFFSDGIDKAFKNSENNAFSLFNTLLLGLLDEKNPKTLKFLESREVIYKKDIDQFV